MPDNPSRVALRFTVLDRGGSIAVLAVVTAFVLSATIDRFATIGTAYAIARSISVLGIMALGMSVVVVGRNIDLSQVAMALISTGAVVRSMQAGLSSAAALLLGGGLALAMGTVNAGVVRLGKVPPLFATLASAMMFIGVARLTILPGASIYLPPGDVILARLGGNIGRVPIPPLIFAGCAALTYTFVERTVVGRFIRALGINPRTAALIGLPIDALTWLQYATSAMAAFVGGLLMLSSSGLVDLQAANSTMIFDILLVVVLGGVSLSGGRGSVFGVVTATIFVGIMLNAMTIMDIGFEVQSIIKGVALLLVIVVDGLLRRHDAGLDDI